MSLSSLARCNLNQDGTEREDMLNRTQHVSNENNRLAEARCVGKGEVVSSNLTGSTSNYNHLTLISTVPLSSNELGAVQCAPTHAQREVG